jgi:hypothetical protein
LPKQNLHHSLPPTSHHHHHHHHKHQQEGAAAAFPAQSSQVQGSRKHYIALDAAARLVKAFRQRQLADASERLAQLAQQLL